MIITMIMITAIKTLSIARFLLSSLKTKLSLNGVLYSYILKITHAMGAEQ